MTAKERLKELKAEWQENCHRAGQALVAFDRAQYRLGEVMDTFLNLQCHFEDVRTGEFNEEGEEDTILPDEQDDCIQKLYELRTSTDDFLDWPSLRDQVQELLDADLPEVEDE